MMMMMTIQMFVQSILRLSGFILQTGCFQWHCQEAVPPPLRSRPEKLKTENKWGKGF